MPSTRIPSPGHIHAPTWCPTPPINSDPCVAAWRRHRLNRGRAGGLFMATGSERYRGHKVWETLQLKRDSLAAARFDDAASEQRRNDVVEWLTEAAKTKLAKQPALYLSTLDPLREALNALPTTTNEFKQYVADGYGRQQGVDVLEAALRTLPLPPPKDLKDAYVALLDAEIEARTKRLTVFEERILETEKSLNERADELTKVTKTLETRLLPSRPRLLSGRSGTMRWPIGSRSARTSTPSAMQRPWSRSPRWRRPPMPGRHWPSTRREASARPTGTGALSASAERPSGCAQEPPSHSSSQARSAGSS
jgi:hypothetical protein